MAVPSNHYKLGLFVLITVIAVAAVLFALGASALQRQTVAYHTYFNESVQGLEVGAPVKFRGVTIGSVGTVTVAPDHRHVDVVQNLDVDDIKRMGLAHFSVPPDLRAQLGTQGITGVKFISIDFVNPVSNPPPKLPFATPENYIPAAPSVLKNLEDTVTKAMDQLPDLINALLSVALRIDGVIGDLQRHALPEKAAETLARAQTVLGSIDHVVRDVGAAKLPQKIGRSLEDLAAAVGHLNGLLEHIDGENGLVASVQRASDAVGSFGRGANAATHELDQTLRDVREAAESVRRLADDIDDDPDMLVKGRAKAKHTTDVSGGGKR